MAFNITVNEGPLDRAVRIILGVFLAAAAYLGLVPNPLNLLFYIVAAVLIITGAIGFCGIYTLLGINTLPKEKKR
ncbi:MAG: DUF2892 domain-containing protein [Candidatus Micrarchaeia archaeon]